MVSRQNPHGVGDNYGSGRRGTGHGVSQSQKDKAAAKGKSGAEVANKAANNNTNTQRSAKKR